MADPKAALSEKRRRERERIIYGGVRFLCGYCKECGEAFVAASNWRYQCFCSKRCCIRENRRRQRHRRRARKLQVPSELISLLVLAERDGWTCHICRKKVTRKSWSVDHLVPLCDGGHDIYANVALAHWHCNAVRSHRGHAQLLLDAASVEMVAPGRATKPCAVCNGAFVPKDARSLTCSQECRAEMKRRRENARYYALLASPEGRERIQGYRRASSAKRRGEALL